MEARPRRLLFDVPRIKHFLIRDEASRITGGVRVLLEIMSHALNLIPG
jgi:hypothetical protein